MLSLGADQKPKPLLPAYSSNSSLSPDGHWVAYSWQQGSLVSVLGFYRTRLVVAPTAHPDDTTRFAWYINYAATAGTVTGILKPEWLDADRIRFLGAYEFFFKVKGGGQERYTDTTFVPLALLEVDLRTGLVALVPGGDSATAWAWQCRVAPIQSSSCTRCESWRRAGTSPSA